MRKGGATDLIAPVMLEEVCARLVSVLQHPELERFGECVGTAEELLAALSRSGQYCVYNPADGIHGSLFTHAVDHDDRLRVSFWNRFFNCHVASPLSMDETSIPIGITRIYEYELHSANFWLQNHRLGILKDDFLATADYLEGIEFLQRFKIDMSQITQAFYTALGAFKGNIFVNIECLLVDEHIFIEFNPSQQFFLREFKGGRP